MVCILRLVTNLDFYSPNVFDAPPNLNREAYGISRINNSTFILYGGYNIRNGEVSDISPFNVFYQLSFNYTVPINSSRVLELLWLYVGVGSGSGFLIFVSLCLYLWHKVLHKKYLQENKIRLQENEALENSKKQFEERVINLVNDDSFTATMALPNNMALCARVSKILVCC
jgi:hypothetical protein